MKIKVKVAPGIPPLMNGDKVYTEPLCLYHWSPTSRRKAIERSGLVPGSWSIDRDWKPPHICYSANPHLAFDLSVRIHPEIESWDLWMVFAEDAKSFEAILELYTFSDKHYIKEYRVYSRIYKRHVHYIGTRTAIALPSAPQA